MTLALSVVCLILKKWVTSKSAFISINSHSHILRISDISPFWQNAKHQRLVRFSSVGPQRTFSMKSTETSLMRCPWLETLCSIPPLPLGAVPLRWPSVLVFTQKHGRSSGSRDGPTELLQMPWKLFQGHWYRTVEEMPSESWLNLECVFSLVDFSLMAHTLFSLPDHHRPNTPMVNIRGVWMEIQGRSWTWRSMVFTNPPVWRSKFWKLPLRCVWFASGGSA